MKSSIYNMKEKRTYDSLGMFCKTIKRKYRNMKLKNRILLITSVFTIISIATIYFFNSNAVIKDYTSFENEQNGIEVNRSIEAVLQMSKRLEPIVIDWAEWDDAYYFVDGVENNFENINMVPNTFEKLRANYIALVDNENNIITAKGYDYIEEKTKEVPRELIEYGMGSSIGSNLILINGRPVVITVGEITDSNSVKESNGRIIFGFSFDELEQATMNANFSTDIIFEDTNYNLEKKGVWVTKEDGKIAANFVIPYRNNDNGLKCKVYLSNEIVALGKATAEKSLVYTAITLVLLSLVLYLVVKKYVLNEVSHLSEVTNEIIRSKKITKRVKVNGSEEFRRLKADFNYMLEIIEQANSRLKYQANNDLLTETINRRGCFNLLESATNKHREDGLDFTICYFDIDKLKYVNDSLGHDEGDKMIKVIVETVKSTIREEDSLCRIGGDEFIIIFADLGKDAAEKIVERIDSRMEEVNGAQMFEYKLSISKGLVQYENKMTIDEMIALADAKMYKDKRINRKV